MNTAQFITKYNGQVVRGGQCGELVRQYWIDVDQTAPPSYPNSKDYWFNPVPGYDKVSSPQIGDIAVFNGHGVYTEGHSAIYVGNGQVFEQNADPDGSPAHIFTRANTYLLGYLRKQGKENDMPELVNDGDIVNIYQGMLGRQPSADEIAIYRGKSYKEMLYAFMDSAEFKARVAGSGPAPTVLKKGTYSVQ